MKYIYSYGKFLRVMLNVVINFISFGTNILISLIINKKILCVVLFTLFNLSSIRLFVIHNFNYPLIDIAIEQRIMSSNSEKHDVK